MKDLQCTLLLHSVTVESCIHPRSSACWLNINDRIVSPPPWSASAAPQLISGAEKIRDNPRDLRLTPLGPAIIFYLSSPVGSYIRRDLVLVSMPDYLIFMTSNMTAICLCFGSDLFPPVSTTQRGGHRLCAILGVSNHVLHSGHIATAAAGHSDTQSALR